MNHHPAEKDMNHRWQNVTVGHMKKKTEGIIGSTEV
jgi:hypothetical protein